MMKSLDNIKAEDDVEKIYLLRKRLNMKQYEFAQAIGISASHLGKIESYKVLLSPKIKSKINNYISKLDKGEL